MSGGLLKKLELGPFQSNCYLVGGADSDQMLVVDPGAESKRIVDAIEATDREPVEIWATHGHMDHVGAVKPLQDRYDLSFFVHREDEELVRHIEDQARSFGLPVLPEPGIDGYLEAGLTEERAGVSLEIRFTPGHSPGGLTFYEARAGRAFVGDCVFSGSIGRTDFPNADHQTLLSSIREEILSLPDDTTLLPGHGSETTVDQERRMNPHLRDMRMPDG